MEVKIVKADESLKLVDFGVEATNVSISVTEFMEKLSVFRFNDPIQRNSVWKLEKKSLAIISIIEKVYIGEISVQILRENKKKIRNVIDGKQRLTTARDYVKNKFPLTNVPYIEGVDENGETVFIDVNGYYFKDLPCAFQNRIMSHMIHIREYEIDEEQKQEFFYRWNNGESLKPSERRKSRMAAPLRSALAEMKASPVIQAGLNENDLNRDANGDLVQQAMALIITNNDTGLGSGVIDKMVKENMFSDEVIENVKGKILFLNNIYESLEVEARASIFQKTKTKTPSILYVLHKFADVESVKFTDFLKNFFVDTYSSTGYASYSNSSTTKKSFVQKRTDILLSAAKEWFDINEAN
ncbi:DUF262 domain-containing protein [Paenibacillaceae bacterium]|nr:DUF262 domain-containing protein [Paenibacillaceae bacterium]